MKHVDLMSVLLMLATVCVARGAGMTGHLVPDRSISDATVTGVTSGDEIIIVITGQDPIRVHLEGIAAPRLDQPFGARAKEELTKFTLGKHVAVFVHTVISQTEIAGTVFATSDKPNVKTNVNIEMVSRGLAWYDPRSELVTESSDRSLFRNMDLKDFMDEAKKARRGLWADRSPVPPWEWEGKETEGGPNKPVETTSGTRPETRESCSFWVALRSVSHG